MDYLRTINRVQLKQMTDEKRDFVLIDILPAEFYEEVHLPGAVNACVYDVTFIAEVDALVQDKSKTIVVYCNGATSKAGDSAMQKLNAAGYTNIYIYKGGTIDWRRAGNPVEGTNTDKNYTLHVEEKVYTIDVAESVMEWTGRNITGAHYGTINLLSGSIPIRRGQPLNATFTVDINSIANLDVQDPALNRMLVNHLKSDDFFDVKKFPTAKFDATVFDPIAGAKAGAPNYEVTGKLTMKGVTNDISFSSVVSLREDLAITAEAHFDIDRTLWNVNYGSGRFFEKLGRHLVYDNISLQLKLVAK
ncbi:MAG: YceI family protein [Chthoniobacteraceae bacterium]